MSFTRRFLIILLLLPFADCRAAELQQLTGKTVTLETPAGVRFGLWGKDVSYPAPTLFIFSASIPEALNDPYFRQCGNALAEQGYLCVSLDLPGHGQRARRNTPGLMTWRYHSDQSTDFVAPFTDDVSKVLDHLIKAGYTDPDRIAACGTSRGGFMAIHAAAAEPRIKATAAFAPVTNLKTLREFHGAENSDHIDSLSVNSLAEKLSGRSLWLVIGDRDERVGTDDTIEFARLTTAASLKKKQPADVTLLVLPEIKGHTTPAGSPAIAADWIQQRLNTNVTR